MTILVPIVLIGWIPVVLGLFVFLPPRRAVIVAFIAAWLFLPNAGYGIAGLPDYTKMSATALGVLLGTGLFDTNRLNSFRLRWFDIPMLVLCTCPMASAVLNGLGAYEGMSAVFSSVVIWGLPYYIGRIYFGSSEALRDLALGIFIGGLIYMPLCLWEIRMSPQLHYNLYGFSTRSFSMAVRYGGYRPVVFMWTYLALAHWMTMATVVGFWLWRGARLRQLWGVPTVILLLGMSVTLVLCKMFTAFVLLLIGVSLPLLMVRFRTSLPFAILLLMVPLYMGMRASGFWLGQELVTMVERVDETRAASLATRITNENRLAERALERPFFGWGRFGRSRVRNEQGKDITLSDGAWIIALGQGGMVRLAAWIGIFAIPLMRFVRHYPGSVWVHPVVAPTAAIGMIVLLTFVNNLPNSTVNPIIVAAIGGLISLEGLKSLPGGGKRVAEYASSYVRRCGESG